MAPKLEYRPRDPAAFPRWSFETLDFDYDPASQSVWMAYKAEGPPFYSFQTLSDMADIRESLRGLFASPQIADWPIRYFVMTTHKPGVFNLGGDLETFARAIKAKDQETLTAYAYACIDVVHGLVSAAGLPIVTVSAIAGQALGGGFEAALSQDFLLAERTAKIGVPEVAFNSFPGMGAVSLLSRRVGMARAEEIIASGEVYSGEQAFELGVVDVLAEAGEARQAALDWMNDGGEERFDRRLAIATARRRLFPIGYDELVKITDLWVLHSSEITAADVRHMERLAAAQKRMVAAVG